MPRETHAPGPKTHVTPLQRYISTLLTCKVTLAAVLTVGITAFIPFYSSLFRMAAPRWQSEALHLYPGTVIGYAVQSIIVFVLCAVPALAMVSVEGRHAARGKNQPGEKRLNSTPAGDTPVPAHLPTLLRVTGGNVDKLFKLLRAGGMEVARWQAKGQVNTQVKTALVCWLPGNDRHRYSIALQEFPGLLSDELLVLVAPFASPGEEPRDEALLARIIASLEKWGARLTKG